MAAFDEFVRSISPGDEVVFVFSGHGWSDGGDNYLSFSDAPKGVSEAVLQSETIALKQQVMARLRSQNPKILLAIIDACRDESYDPLTKSNGSLEKGIVRISANEGELILYSAAQGQTSLDRLSNADSSKYSVFTRVLLPRLSDTARPLARIANETRTEVQRLAGTISHPQRPEMMLGIDLDFCLSGSCNIGGAAPARAAVPVDDPREKGLWTKVLAEGSVPALEAYLEQYPNTPNAETARALIRIKSNNIARDEAPDQAEAAVAVKTSTSSAASDSIYLRPGLWETETTHTIKFTRNGEVLQGAEVPTPEQETTTDCVSEAEANVTPAAWIKQINEEGEATGSTCQLIDGIVNGQNMAIQTACETPEMPMPLEGYIDLTVNEAGDSAEAHMDTIGEVNGISAEISSFSTSRWLGACDAEETISVTAGN